MIEKTYILTPGCRLLTTEEISEQKLPLGEETDDLLAGRLFLLEDGNNYHLVNPTIRAFLDAFTSPQTLKSVVRSFADQAGCEPSQIEAVMSVFFQDMEDKDFLTEASNEAADAEMGNWLSFQEGQVLEKYLLKRLLFEKKQLDIFLAEDLESGRQVALKLMKSEDRSLRNTFLHEFQLMQELGAHPHVCGCYGWQSTPQYCYGILEFIEGKGMRSHIRNENPGLEERLILAGQVLSSLAFVHQKKMLHGDIHLSNFMVEDSTRHPKLIDFNMANRETPAENEFVWEGGVYQYIPPEKVDARAFQYVRERSDYASEAWQAGVVLYFIFYGDLPFDDFSWQKLARKIVEEEPVFPDVIPTGEPLPEWVAALLRRSLEKDPGKRFSSAIEQYRQWKKAMKLMETPINELVG